MSRALAIGACVIGLVHCIAAATAGVSDFAMFLATARALVEGGLPYEVHQMPAGPWRNLLPPHAHVLFLPLVVLPDAAAAAVWKVCDLTLLFGSLWFTMRQTAVSTEFALWTLAAVTNATPTLVETYAGQVTGPLLAGLTFMLWKARTGRWISAGIAWGVLCSVKPFLGLLACWFLRRGRPSALPVGLMACSVAWGLGLLAFGRGATEEWVKALGHVGWEWSPVNASVTGLVYRTCDGVTCEPVRWLLVTGILLATAFAVFRSRAPLDDELVATLVLAALLVSPLGWVYYIWLVIPTLVAMAARAQRVPLAAIGLLVPPTLLQLGYGSGALAPWLGSTYSLAMLGMWLELTWRISASRWPVRNEALTNGR